MSPHLILCHDFLLFPTPSLLPSSHVPLFLVPHTLSRRLPPRSQNVFETTGLWCSLSLDEDDLNVYLQGVDLKTDATICEEWVRRGAAMLRVLFGGGTLGNVRSSKKAISKLPWISRSPRMDISPSSLAVRSRKVSPTSIHAIHAATSPEMPYERNPTEVP